MEKIVLENLSDQELIDMVAELQSNVFTADSNIRKIAVQEFGATNALNCSMVGLIILPVLAERFKRYSPHIEK